MANKVLSTTENTELEDAYGNKIVVPAGFKIVSNSDTDNATTVDKGIVIEDATTGATAGSQFVWVPVGKIYTDTAKTNGSTATINLDRYTFDENGNPTAQGEKGIDSYYNEGTSNGNAVAKYINSFKTSVATNGGYYIGRYEARKNSRGAITEVGIDTVWNNISQSDAAIKSQNMYNSNKFTSDLMNSYAWDTATLFLQICGTNATYSRQIRVSSTLSQTGTNIQSTKDVQCNVYDLASNVYEWTTETFVDFKYPCVSRGGNYYDSSTYMSGRHSYSTSRDSGFDGFRPLLFVNV